MWSGQPRRCCERWAGRNPGRVDWASRKPCRTRRSERRCVVHVLLPKLRQFSILKPIFPCLSCIYGAPLLRIYAKYPLYKGKVWFDGMPKIVTNAILRQIIPINPSTGLIMISYTDGQDLDPFWKDKRQKRLKEDKDIEKMIHEHLTILFPHIVIPKPNYFKTHLWTIGCHHWKKGCDSEKMAKRIQNPLPRIHIVGEAFSHKQAWVEGALETVKNNI